MMAIRRLQRHNRGIEIRVPTDVSMELEARAGDYLAFDWQPGDSEVKLKKVSVGGKRDGEEKKEKDVIPTAISTR